MSNRLLVGFLRALPALCLLLAPNATLAWPVKLVASDGFEGQGFGISVALSGDAALVGANRFGRLIPPYHGSAYFFRWDGDRWVEERRVEGASPADVDDGFGARVAIAGDVALVGAHLEDEGAGAAYVYRYDGSGWHQEQRLVASDPLPTDYFGSAVAISGDLAVIGASWAQSSCHGSPYCRTGAAYVFRYAGGAWVQEAELLPADPTGSDGFGAAVAIAAGEVMVGATGDPARGAVFVYRREASSWSRRTTLTISDGEGTGGALAVSGNVAVVGTPPAGAAYVFRSDGADWIEEAKLTGSAFEGPGLALSTSGTADVLALAGRVFRHDGAEWREEGPLPFAYAAAISNERILTGVPSDAELAWEAGAAYVYDGPACGNQLDDDGDGLTDLDDPGCRTAADLFETDPSMACDDARDNDGDGLADRASDPGCASATDGSEQDPSLPCDNGLDDDGDGYSDRGGGDPGCAAPDDPDASETDTTGMHPCDDDLDNDGDGLTDGDDPGCSSGWYDDEMGGACDDDSDNDGDGRTDFPADPGCTDLVDATEAVLFADGGSHVIDASSSLSDEGVLVEPHVRCLECGAEPTELRLVEGGAIAFDVAVHGSIFEISGGTVGGDVSASDCFYSSCLSLTGGIVAGGVSAENVFSFGAPGVVLGGAEIGGGLELRGFLTADLSAGAVRGAVETWGSSFLRIRGGVVGGVLRLHDQSVVEVLGTGFDLPESDVTALAGTLTGTLSDGTPLALPFVRDPEATLRLATPRCGDGFVTGAEACDDGNTGGGDGCDAGCALECGNGRIDGQERCDDGNTEDGDGCSADCRVEPIECGNGQLDGSEECDEGISPVGGSCAANCEFLWLSEGELACVSAIHEDWARVLATQGRDTARCLGRAAAGKLPLGSCLGQDTRGKVAKAGRVTARTEAERCSPIGMPGLDDFAFTSAAVSNSAASEAALGAFAALFGDPPHVAARREDGAAARCQAAVARHLRRLVDARAGALLRAAGFVHPGATPFQVQWSIDQAMDPSADPRIVKGIEKAEAKARAAIAERCRGVEIDQHFDCGGAASADALASCVVDTARRAACESLEAADGVNLHCGP